MNSAKETYCKIHGLTSARGQTLNGRAASFDPQKKAHAGRVAVSIDGVPSDLSLKPDNLLNVGPDWEDITITVGRQDLRSEHGNAVAVDNKRGVRLVVRSINAKEEGTVLRTGGILSVLKECIQKLPNSKSKILIQLTDLNLALLFNSYADKGDAAPASILAGSQQHLAEKIGKKIVQLCRKRTIMFKFTSLRIHRGDFPPNDLVKSIKASHFHIYPCPHKNYLDAMEARFTLPNRSTLATFLDFGKAEAVQYAQNSISMGNFDQLMPTTLADCDPTMFFSFVLHSKAVVKELKRFSCSDELVKEWATVCAAYIKSVIAIKEICPSQSEAARILPNPDGNWNLLNDQIHYNIAYRNAKLILALGMQWTLENATAPPRIELFDHYIGTDIDQKLTELRQALNSQDPSDIELVLQDIMNWRETKTCDFCGVQNKKMYDCTGCYSAGYCSSEIPFTLWT